MELTAMRKCRNKDLKHDGMMGFLAEMTCGEKMMATM